MNQGQLLDVAAAIADGIPIDWAACAGGLPLTSPDLTPPARLVERIAQVHASLPALDSFTSSLHQSLRLPSDPHAPTDTPVTWGTLTIVEKIGRGTFGDVYRAHDRRLNRPVALKLLRRKDRLESVVIDEGQLMARVRHPNVVTVYGAERIEERVGLWMQFVDGPTLEAEVKTRGPFTPADVVQAGIQLAQALAAVHGAGLLHRDVKAQNAMRDADGRVLLTDFGTGRELADLGIVTGARELAGTPLYIAPEVLDGAPASVSSDVYSLGVLLYHLATGSFPVRGRSLRDLRDAHQRHARTSVRTARPDMSKRLGRAIDRATDPDPARRPGSAADLEAALAASSRSRTPRLTWVAAAATFAILAAAAAVTLRPRPQPAFPTSRAPSQLRDFVLVARFDNTTGETAFDGGVEYAIARELRKSDVIDVIPAESVLDALQLMKRPINTIVDRATGREISLRDGRIKALVTGRIERTGWGFSIATELVDPADGSVAGSVTSTADRAEAVLPTITREAHRVTALFEERRAKIKGATPLAQVSTTSLAALQLYNQALDLVEFPGTQERAERALELNTRALAEDPSFAAAWILQTSLLRQLKPPGKEDRDAAARALALAEAAPEWERRYVRGVARSLNRDYTGALPEFEAVVRLRPDFQPGLDYLESTARMSNQPEAALAAYKAIADQRPFDIQANGRAALSIVGMRSPDEARPYLNRLDDLMVPERSRMPGFYWTAGWRRMLPAYEAWKIGDVAGAQSIVDREAHEIPAWQSMVDRDAGGEGDRARLWLEQMVGLFCMTFGRFHDAERHFLDIHDGVEWLLLLADARDDLPAMRRYLMRTPLDQRAHHYVKAGLLQQAHARLALRLGVLDSSDVVDDLARGTLELASGRPESGVRLLRKTLPYVGFASDYQIGCGLLATALVRLNRQAQAIFELERCAAAPPKFFGNFLATFWMKNLLQLADEYRVVGRIADAERIEQQLRGLLVYADADNPLVMRLNARDHNAH